MPDGSEYLAPRGVHRLPVLTHLGDMILYASDHNHRMLKDGMVYVAPGDNPFPFSEQLWERLNAEDPVAEPPQGLPQTG